RAVRGQTWRGVVHTGLGDNGTCTGSAYTADVDVNAVAAAIAADARNIAGDVQLKLYDSTTMRDGRYANNALLQELPDPVSKVTWDTYAAINPNFAEQSGIAVIGRANVEVKGP